MPASVQEQQLIEAIHHSFIEAQVADIVSDYPELPGVPSTQISSELDAQITL